MKTAPIAAVMASEGAARNHARVLEILGFLGIPYRSFESTSQLVSARESPSSFAIIAPLPAVQQLYTSLPEEAIHSCYAYLHEDDERAPVFVNLASGPVSLLPIASDKVHLSITTEWPELTGPMHGVETTAAIDRSQRFVNTDNAGAIRKIVDTERGTAFFQVEGGGRPLFVNCSSVIPDLQQPMSTNWYDARNDFLSAVPLLLYLKWAFRGTCWQASEPAACLIIDDPILRPRYGFCDFKKIDCQMQEHGFTTNVAVIPWNWRRTSTQMASLIQNSHGRLSVSVHGCDHTGGEFGDTERSRLDAMAATAKLRMERHHAKTGIAHDLVMIFPQGVFSTESLEVLQQHQYLAAVNTEARPVNGTTETPTVGDMWSVATTTKNDGVPFFARRYPAHGIANFAFDLLVGKPCLIVEHHTFFKEGGQRVLEFVRALNSLNCKLNWLPLGDVLRRSYAWRERADGSTEVRMFANELLLANPSSETKTYNITKAHTGKIPIDTVLAGGEPVKWKATPRTIEFAFNIPAGREILFQVRHRPPPSLTKISERRGGGIKVAGRRYLSEFRDNFLSRHEGLLQIAQSMRGKIPS